jgi:hypothetical protein
MRIWLIIMTENFEIQTVSEAMKTMSDEDLAFIAAYNPKAMRSLCTMWALELELKKEGKLSSHTPVKLKTKKPRNWFVYLRITLQTWLFSRLLRMVSKR